MNLLHLSDLHFGKHFLPDVGEALLARAERLGPDAVVVSGDLTQRAKPREFEQARAFLDRLPAVPRIVVPGNHDIPLYRIHERLLNPRGLYRRHIADPIDCVLHRDDAVIVGLDSTDPYGSLVNGRIHARQLDFCRRAFAQAADDALRLIVLHHHLIPPPTFERPPPMPKAKRALEALTELHVDVVLAGHLHRAYVGNSLDVHGGPRREHGIIVVQCGTSTSRRGRGFEREKNTFNWLCLSDATVEVEHFMYFDEHRDFSPIARHTFARPGGGRLAHGLPRTTRTGE